LELAIVLPIFFLAKKLEIFEIALAHLARRPGHNIAPTDIYA